MFTKSMKLLFSVTFLTAAVSFTALSVDAHRAIVAKQDIEKTQQQPQRKQTPADNIQRLSHSGRGTAGTTL